MPIYLETHGTHILTWDKGFKLDKTVVRKPVS